MTEKTPIIDHGTYDPAKYTDHFSISRNGQVSYRPTRTAEDIIESLKQLQEFLDKLEEDENQYNNEVFDSNGDVVDLDTLDLNMSEYEEE